MRKIVTPCDPNLLPYLMNRLVSRMNQVWLGTLRGHGLTTQRWQVLSIITAVKGLRVQDIAHMSGLEQAVLTRVLDQMIRDGLAEKRANPKDGRSRLVHATKAGQDLHRDLMPEAEAFISKAFGPISDNKRNELARQVTDITARLEEELDNA